MQTRPPPAPRPRDLGKLAARLFCALFALVGAVPFGAGLLVRVAAVQDWAKAEAARILDRELGVRADYDVRMQAWPLRVALENVVVPASDGKGPVLRADAVAVEPKLFSLLAGRLDVGDVEIERPRVRVVLRDGKLKNLRYRSFDRPDSGQALERAPFSSLAVTEAFVAADVDGLEVESEGIDIDVFAEDNWVFEAALRVGQTRFARRRPLLEPGKPAARAVDDDVLCRLDLRLRSEPGDLLILRFSALGVADDRPAPNTTPSCERALAREDPSRVALRLSQLRVRYPENRPTLIDGHVLVQAPASLTNRFVRTMPLTGSASFAGNVRFDSASRLPELRGRVRGSGIAFGGYRLAAELDADVVLNGEVIKVPRYFMRFADGRVRLTNAEIRPLAPGVPIKVERVDGDGMQFEGLMRDLDVTPDTIVQWRLTDTRVTGIDGTLNPLQLDAALSAETRDFEVFDRSFRDEHRSHMIGVKAARVKGKLRVVPEAFQIRDAAVSFGKSSLFVKLVSIGFANEIELDVAKGSKIDLSDVSPLVDIPMAGKAELGVEMSGLASDPVLTGQAKILGFELGGFPLGDVLESQLKFRPLVLELSDVKARKGKSPYLASSARLDFGGAATIEADAAVQSPGMSLRDFFAMWHFDADPRFADLDGTGAVESRVRYALGGPEDRCGGGRLRVTGSARFEPLDMFEERYDSAQADFDFHWIDRDASYLGIELDVPNVTLRKGPGVLLGSFHMRPGAEVRGQMVGTALPLSKLDAFGALGPLLDAEIGAVAEVGGTLDSLTALVNAQLSPLRAGQGTFPASELTVRLDPIARPPNVVGKTRCGRPKPGEFDAAEWKQDRPQGTFVASGQLFGGQIAFSDLHVSRQRSKVVRGELALRGLDVGAAAALASFGGGEKSALSGELSGRVTLDTFYMQRAAASTASLDLRELSLKKNGVTLAVAPGKNRIALRDGRLELPSLALSVKTPFGHSAVFDVKGAARDLTGDPKLEAELVLRPVPLETFANLLPRIEKAKG
ncbi:MAG TPA: hypothetical protein VF989_04670, partial [Polyangiaceae bacterium]